MPDGIAQMLQAREAASRRRGGAGRQIPPSRKKPRTTPVEMPVRPQSETEESTPDPIEPPASPPPAPGKATAVQSSPAETGSAQKAPQLDELVKKTIYLGSREDDFIEQVYFAGRRAPGGKVDANRGAVVRLALRRLAAELSAEQVVEEIRAGITRPPAGRPRF